MSSWKQSRFIRFIEEHKGNVALGLSLALYLLSWPLAVFNRAAGEIARAAGQAALVGGICDYIALNMIFERHWYLPNSGVLPRNREKLIEGISTTIEREWLTPAMIGQKLHELRLLDRLGEHLETASLKTMIRAEQLERICRAVARQLEPETVTGLIQRLSGPGKPTGPWERLRGVLVKTFVRHECDRLREMIRDLPRDEQLLGAVDTAIHDIGSNLRDAEGVIRKTADHWMEAIVSQVVMRSRGEIAQMVRENLNRMSNEAIRKQIETRTRTHLDWIRVNGGVFGAILGCLFALLNAARADFHVITRFIMF